MWRYSDRGKKDPEKSDSVLENEYKHEVEIFSSRLKKSRITRNMTQNEVARMAGISSSTYSLYESGRRIPNIIILKKLCMALDISADWLICNSHEFFSDENISIDGFLYTEEQKKQIRNFARFIRLQGN